MVTPSLSLAVPLFFKKQTLDAPGAELVCHFQAVYADGCEQIRSFDDVEDALTWCIQNFGIETRSGNRFWQYRITEHVESRVQRSEDSSFERTRPLTWYTLDFHIAAEEAATFDGAWKIFGDIVGFEERPSRATQHPVGGFEDS